MPVFEMMTVLRTDLGTRARVVTASVTTAYQEGADPVDTETVDRVEVMHPVGFAARPVVPADPRSPDNTVEALCIELGRELVIAAIVDKGGAVWTDLEAGETRVYGAGNAACRARYKADGAMDVEVPAGKAVTIRQADGGTIVIDANGDVRIDSKASGKVYVQNGTKNVAREESIVNGGTLTAVAGPYPVTFTHVPGGTGSMPTAPPGGVVLQGRILTGEGNPRIKV